MKECWVACEIPTSHYLSGRASSLSFYYLIFKCYNYIDLFVLRGWACRRSNGNPWECPLLQHAGQGTELRHPGWPRAPISTESTHWPCFYEFVMGFHVAKTGPQLVVLEDDLDPASSTSQGLRLQMCCGHGAVDGTQGLLHALLTE